MVNRSEAENFLRDFARWHCGVRVGYLFGRLALFANRQVLAQVVNGRIECRVKRRVRESRLSTVTLHLKQNSSKQNRLVSVSAMDCALTNLSYRPSYSPDWG